MIEFERQLSEQKLQAELKQKKLCEIVCGGKVWFQGQFNAIADSKQVTAITIHKIFARKATRFSTHQKGFDCLPFTADGYDRAIKYLHDKYDYPSEFAGHYVIVLFELQPVTECYVRKIHNFYEKLLFTVESLRILGKLETIEGAALHVITKKLE